jgi:putative FmdB family regulatory protein
MPIYTYQAKGPEHCLYCVEPFDRNQKLDAPRLKTCPECQSPLRRVITPPNLASSSPNVSEQNLGKKGFTQYRKLEKGVYEKTVGKGPDIITDKD